MTTTLHDAHHVTFLRTMTDGTPADALWRVDGVTVLLLLLVVGIAAAVLPFAHRSLRGDRHGRAVTIAIAAMLVATAVLSLSASLWLFGVSWSASTVATLLALAWGGGSRAVAPAFVWLLVSDAALWAGIVLVALDVPVDSPALLFVLAAVLRCALPPAHGWLVGSLYAPTPVSAALHGGIVNGGGILVITQWEIVGASALATSALAILAGGGVVIGVLVSLVRTDIKGRLVFSTVAQMGFMLLCASLGLVAAALLHLVAHGFYKSSLFLASSDGIDRRAHERRAPRATVLGAQARVLRALGGGAVPVIALVATALIAYPGGRGLAELLVLLVVASAFAAAGARASVLAPSAPLAIASTLALAAGATLYALATSTLTGLITTSPSPPSAALTVGVAALVVVALLFLIVVRRWFPHSGTGLTLVALGHAIGESHRNARRVRPQVTLSPQKTGALS